METLKSVVNPVRQVEVRQTVVAVFEIEKEIRLENNLVIADLLRGTQRKQDEHYQASQSPGGQTALAVVM